MIQLSDGQRIATRLSDDVQKIAIRLKRKGQVRQRPQHRCHFWTKDIQKWQTDSQTITKMAKRCPERTQQMARRWSKDEKTPKEGYEMTIGAVQYQKKKSKI